MDDLVALDFNSDIDHLIEDFTGREWVFQEIEDWLNRQNEPFFILTGEPGIGKSAIAARLTRVRDDIAAFHFCIAGRNSTIQPATTLRSITAQLGERVPGYGQALAKTIQSINLSVQVEIDVEEMTGGEITGLLIQHLHLGSTKAGNPQEELEILLSAPLKAIPTPPSPIVILIDSLDEAVNYQGKPNLVSLLAGLGDLPGWVRFICTSRPERRVLSYFDNLDPHVVSAESQMNLGDLRLYISNGVKEKAIAARIQSAHLEPESLVSHLIELSSGNFLYAKILLNDIRDGHQALDDLDALPQSLDEIYHGILRRFSTDDWETRYQPMLAVLAVAQEPITEDQLAAFSGTSRTKTRQHLGVVLQFLDTIKDRAGRVTYRLFHQSFRDYLLDQSRNQDFWCASEDGHSSIASACLKRCRDGWDACDEYCRAYVAVHLAGSEMWETLSGLLEDPSYLLAAAPEQLLVVINSGWGRLPQRSVHVYQRSVHYMRENTLPSAAAYLELVARQSRADDLADRVAGLNLPRPWSIDWVRWEYTSPHHVLTRHETGVSGHSKIAVGKLEDRPVVVSACEEIRVSEMESGRLIASAIGETGEKVSALALAELESRPVILTSSREGIRLWELSDCSPIGEVLPGYTGNVSALAIGDLAGSPVVIAGCTDGMLRMWHIADPNRAPDQMAAHQEAAVHALLGTSGKVRCLVLTELAGRPVVVSGGDDKTIRIWDLTDWKPIGEPMKGHTGWVECLGVGVLNDRRVIVSGGAFEEAIRVWDPVARKQISTHPTVRKDFVGNSAIYDLDVGEIEGRPVVVTGSFYKHIQFWNLADGTPAGAPLSGHEGPVKSIVLTELHERPVIVSGGNDGSVRVWPLPGGLPKENTAAGETAASYSISMGELDGKPVICTADMDWKLRILDLATGEAFVEPHPNPVQVYPDPVIGSRHATYAFGLLAGQPVLVVYEPPELGIWDPVAIKKIGASMKVQFKEGGYMQSLLLAEIAGRPVVLAGSSEGDIWVGDLHDREQIVSWRGNQFSAIAVGELGERHLVAVAEYGKDRLIQLRNLSHGMGEGQIAPRHEGYVAAIGLGQLHSRPVVVSGGSEGDVRIWDPGGELITEVQLGARIADIAIGPDSRLVISTSKGMAVLRLDEL